MKMAEQLLDEPKHCSEVLGPERPRWKMIAISVLIALTLFFVCGNSFVALTSLSFDW